MNKKLSTISAERNLTVKQKGTIVSNTNKNSWFSITNRLIQLLIVVSSQCLLPNFLRELPIAAVLTTAPRPGRVKWAPLLTWPPEHVIPIISCSRMVCIIIIFTTSEHYFCWHSSSKVGNNCYKSPRTSSLRAAK